MAALSGVDMEQHEAAIIDGANRVQRVLYLTLPAISGSQYGLSTAAGLFKSVISVILVTIGNKLSEKVTGEEVL